MNELYSQLSFTESSKRHGRFRILLVLLLFVLSTGNIRAQEHKFEIYISSGICLPVGAFSDAQPTSVFTYRPNGSTPDPEFVGFSKEGHGYAENGFNINGGAILNLKSWVSLDLGVGYSSNPVNSESVADHMTEVYAKYAILFDYPGFIIESVPYENQYLKLGILFNKRWDRINILAGPSFGLASLKFPDYSIQTFYFQDYESEANRNFVHTGSKPRSSAFLFGLKSKVNYSLSNAFNVGVVVEYLNADFDYEIELDYLESTEDWSWGPFKDTVNYRVVQIGLELSLKI